MADILPWWATFASAGLAACTAEVSKPKIFLFFVKLKIVEIIINVIFFIRY